MSSMRTVRVTRAKGPFELVEQPIPEPGPGTVRIKVEACGICHSDSITKEAILPGIWNATWHVTKSPRRQESQ